MALKKLLVFIALFISTSAAICQDTSFIISSIDKDLKSKKKTISEILSDPTLMYLHSLTPFREVIKSNADTNTITIVTASEPGVRIEINGVVTTANGQPLSNVLMYFYHTSDKGWYSDTAVHILKYAGDHRHARLFGYVRTDVNGKFTIKTIRPNGYPKSDLAAHIHIQMWNDNETSVLNIPGELQFDDDVRMTDERRAKSLAEGFLIARNEGTKEKPVYNYTIKLKSN